MEFERNGDQSMIMILREMGDAPTGAVGVDDVLDTLEKLADVGSSLSLSFNGFSSASNKKTSMTTSLKSAIENGISAFIDAVKSAVSSVISGISDFSLPSGIGSVGSNVAVMDIAANFQEFSYWFTGVGSISVSSYPASGSSVVKTILVT